jgi:hypothetical protein
MNDEFIEEIIPVDYAILRAEKKAKIEAMHPAERLLWIINQLPLAWEGYQMALNLLKDTAGDPTPVYVGNDYNGWYNHHFKYQGKTLILWQKGGAAGEFDWCLMIKGRKIDRDSFENWL